MDWLREFLPNISLDSVRIRNFESCVQNAPGTRIVDQGPALDGRKLEIRLAPDAALSPDVVRMLNTPRVSITELSTERGAAHIGVRIT